jgi:hypothetical protein
MKPKDFVFGHGSATTLQPAPGVVNVMPDGKVGIGTTNPTEKLDVAGNIHASGKVLASAYSSNSPLIMEAPAGTERARIDDVTGNFGIGTQSPAQKLHVHGGAIFVTATNNSIPGLGGPMILFGGGTPADANGRWGIEYDPNAGGLNFWKPFPNPSGFGNNFLFLANNGKIGLGTATPNQQLEITGNFQLPPSTATAGVIMSGANRFIHNFGAENFFAGANAGNLTMSGAGENTGVGVDALKANVSGYQNTAVGYRALTNNTTGTLNAAIGFFALFHNTTGTLNTAIGNNASASNSVGVRNTAVGSQALFIDIGTDNTAVGQAALSNNVTGTRNTAVGVRALVTNITGTNNTAIGYGADASASTLTNATAIGANAVVSASNSLVLGGTGANAVKVGIGTAIPRAEMDVVGTGAIVVPVGTTAQRPATPVRGMIRFNTSNNKFEGYDGAAWQNLN